jgi:hypothetical protein
VARQARIDEREAVKRSDQFKADRAAYEAYEDRMHRFCMLLFRPLKDKDIGKGWKASASISTDGISISIAYERVEQVPYTSEESSKRKAAAAKKAKKERSELPPKDDYNPAAATVANGLLILGVDPGRTMLVTIVCIDTKGKKHSWRLSRGQYYTEGGILAENRRQSRRYEPLKESFAGLAGAGSSLRASKSSELRGYFEKYAEFESQWWSVALKRRESRSKMQRYIGKKAVMDRFVSGLRKDAEALLLEMSGVRIEVAYGSAGLNMSSTGRGEAAVPTSGTFRAFEKVFNEHGHKVTPTWEHNTTAVSFATGKPTEAVYKRYVGVGKNSERLHHSKAKRPPEVSLDDPGAAEVQAVLKRAAAKAKHRRGGSSAVSELRWSPEQREMVAREEKKEVLRFPACRGLRFCPERRMFYDRDEASAEAIAGLRRLELEGFGRPTAFRCSKRAKKQIDGSLDDGEGASPIPTDAAVDGCSGQA